MPALTYVYTSAHTHDDDRPYPHSKPQSKPFAVYIYLYERRHRVINCSNTNAQRKPGLYVQARYTQDPAASSQPCNPDIAQSASEPERWPAHNHLRLRQFAIGCPRTGRTHISDLFRLTLLRSGTRTGCSHMVEAAERTYAQVHSLRPTDTDTNIASGNSPTNRHGCAVEHKTNGRLLSGR